MAKILLIDDDARVRRLCAALLTQEGHEVSEAADGKRGLAAALEARPDLILCDVTMPALNGHGVLERLRLERGLAATPFIFLTGQGEMADLRVGMNLGADDYLVKPVDPDQLRAAVDARLRRAAARPAARASAPASAEQLRELGLTPREAEVLFWVAQGKTNPEICLITGVRLTTVKKHLESVFRKLGVETRTAAATLAMERLGPPG